MKYRKKNIIIEAEQYNGNFVRGICPKNYCVVPFAHVHTIHDNQAVQVEIGDWIMPEANQINYYPVKNDIFIATYDPVEN